MARATPRVQEGLLDTHDGAQAIPVGTPEWFAWLDEHHVFAFVSPPGSLTARKERRAAGWYWYAYRRRHGSLRSSYLGKSGELTLARLTEVLATLNTAPDKPAIGMPEPRFLLATKITLPTLSSAVIARPRLIAFLSKHVNHKLLLVTGPAGSGKTTLLSGWLRECSYVVAWVSLDEGDNDLARFWSYVLAALQKHAPGLAAHMPTLLPTLQSEALEPFLIPLVNALATLPDKVVLVLDDYHLLTSHVVQESVTFLLEHAPEQICLVIASRVRPPLPLPRLYARRAVVELDFADLRFTRQEAEELLRVLTGSTPTSDDLSRLLEYTEGWVTGLSLAVLSRRAVLNGTAAIPGSQGNYAAIFEYLASEVLAQQSEQVRDFLLCSSPLEQFNGALCDAVLLQDQSQRLLQQLEHENLFLHPLNEQHSWYRYHPLFADFLRTRLEQRYPGMAELLYGRAATWCEQHGMPIEAIVYALRARDFVLSARLIEEQGRDMLMRREVAVLRVWLRTLPEDIVFARPHLCILAAWVQLHTSRSEPVEDYLCATERYLMKAQMAEDERRALHGEIAAIRARVAIYQGKIGQSVVLAHQALHWLAENDHFLRGEVAYSLGALSEVSDEAHAAEEAYRRAIDLSLYCSNLRTTMLAVRALANLYVSQSRLRQARKLYLDGLEYALQVGEEKLPPVGFLSIGLGELCYEWNDLEAAERHLSEGIALGQRGGDVKIWLLGYIGLMYTTLARGDRERTWELFAEAELLARLTSFVRGIAWLKLIRLRLSALQGDLTPLLDWAQECELDPTKEPDVRSEDEYHYLARALIARNEPDLALPLLRRLLAKAERTQRLGYKIIFLLNIACAYELQEEIDLALEALMEALALAEPQGYMRTFIDEGAHVAALLRRLRRSYQQGTPLAQSCSPGYLDRLLRVFGRHLTDQSNREIVGSLSEQLSLRELEVLRLLAAGHSNAEIAAMLVIGLNTVKTHLKNIYDKLGARNRTHAIAYARELQLL